MVNDKSSYELEKLRRHIATKVRELRIERNWTQQALADELQLSQGRLSAFERGDGSFTAEQLFKILSLFNVPASHFVPTPRKRESELQNALARLGAIHLLESTDVVPSEQLEEVGQVVREALVAESPRHIAALAPVLVVNVDKLNLRKLFLQLVDGGLERRFGWVVDNTVEALRIEKPQASDPWARQYRRAELVLDAFRGFLADQNAKPAELSPPDVLDRGIRTKRSLEEAKAASSPISKRWNIVTDLQTQDFADALRGARAAR